MTIRCLPDGRWFDATRRAWRNRRGRPARWPDLEEAAQMRRTRVILAAAHLDHDPGNNRLRNLKSLCQRCHLIHDRPHHLAQRRITYLLRRALGDLFLGPYPVSPGFRKTYTSQTPTRAGNAVDDRDHNRRNKIFIGRSTFAREPLRPEFR
jgi:hypothetical protein